MTAFVYKAVDVDGKDVKGKIDAVDEVDARRLLILQNLDVRNVSSRIPLMQREFGKKEKVKQTDILHFSRQMAAFVHAGLPVIDGLDIISRSTSNKTFAETLLDMRDQIRQGVPFVDALAQHESMLPSYYLGIVRSAELTGRLDVALEHLAVYMEREHEARGRIKSALAYPSVIVGMSVVSVIVLSVFVLPKFVSLFEELNATLPFTTRMLMNFANFSSAYWWTYLVAVGAVVVGGRWMRKQPATKRFLDRTLLKVPLIGEVVLFSGVERVCRILATMWEAGVPIDNAMVAAIQSSNNTVIAGKLKTIQEAVLEGDGLAEPFAAADIFPDAAVQMIAVGEATGTLADQLLGAADFYEREIEFKLKRLTTYFEPLIIIMVSFVVGFVAVALVQAMYGSLSSSQLK